MFLWLVRHQYFTAITTLIYVEVDHAAEAEALETSVVDGEEQGVEDEQQPARGVTNPSTRNLPSGDEDLDRDQGTSGNNQHRHLRKKFDSNSKISRRRDSEGAASPTTRSRRMAEGHRRLAREVSEGMEAARIRDPDLDAKDEDVRLLSKYLVAGPPEREVFHERGVRRLSSEEMQMPSGRILTSSTTIDVMVLYTTAANKMLLSPDQMKAKITSDYATANDALADSGIAATLKVVHTEEASRPCLVCSFCAGSVNNICVAVVAVSRVTRCGSVRSHLCFSLGSRS